MNDTRSWPQRIWRDARGRPRDWRIWLGSILTSAWLLLAALYIDVRLGWAGLTTIGPDQLGSFLEGAFAPLAFLWLVIGYFLQQRELGENTQALRLQAEQIQRSAEQAAIQSEVIAANERHARQETFLRIAQQVRVQLGTIVGLLWVSSQGATAGNGNVSGAEQARLFAELSQSDPEVFSRRMLETHISCSKSERMALFYGTVVRARHTNHFIKTFERLVRRAQEVDPDGMIVDALRSNAHGLIYGIAREYHEQAPDELRDAVRTGTYAHMGEGKPMDLTPDPGTSAAAKVVVC